MRIQQHPSQRFRRAPDQTLIADVLAGLKDEPKHLSPMYFYDEHGSHLFDRICSLPEYYLTRTETHILARYASEMAAQIGPDAVLVELGSGASTKTRLLLDQMPDLAAYVPVDISRSHLFAAARGIRESYPNLEVLPVCADFTQPFAVPAPRRAAGRVAVFFPGSTIGNFDPPAAVELLRTMLRIAGDSGALLIGYDFVKDRGILEPAYNDAAGVTAAFNLNALVRLNRELGTDFDLTGFRHQAVWEPGASRMEMHLVSERAQDVTVGAETVTFAAGEHLVTEHCHKYTAESFAQLARDAGWDAKAAWTDERRYFNVQYLEPHAQG